MCADLDQPGQSQLGGLVLIHDDDSGRTVRNLRCRSGGDGAVAPERRLETGQRFGGRVGTDSLILGELQRVALALRNIYRHDLVSEDAVLPRRGGLLVRPCRELVLFEPGELVEVVTLLGQRAHRLVGEYVMEAVVGHVVQNRHIAILVARTAIHQQVRRLGHGLLAARDHHVELAGPNELVSQCDGIEPGQTHLVEGQRRHIPTDTGADRCLPCRQLTSSGRQHLAHDHVLDRRRGNIGLLQRAGDRDGAQVTAREILQRTQQLANGRPCPSNDHRCRHDYLQDGVWRPIRYIGETELFPSGYRYVMTTDQVDARRVLATALVTGVNHVGIAVPDLDAAIAWYHDHLGMIVLHEEVNDDQGIREAMLSV